MNLQIDCLNDLFWAFLLNPGPPARIVDETVVDCSLANSRIIADSYRTDALLRAQTR